jgi:uncharacterized protein (TIGR00251 family)
MIKQTENGVIIGARIKPNSKRFALTRKNGRIIIEVISPPHEGKANVEVVKELKRMFKREVEIMKGLRSKDKVILVRGAEMSEIETLF